MQGIPHPEKTGFPPDRQGKSFNMVAHDIL